MHNLLTVVLGFWSVWVAFNLLMVVLAATVMAPAGPCFDGFRVRIPDWTRRRLTPDELAAVVAHEVGHQQHMHTWSNLALRCVFMMASAGRRQRQEWQADDFAAARGHALALAAAIRKLSLHPLDLDRAARLELMAH